MSFFSRILAWFTAPIKASTDRPPYPFDDEEGSQMWNAGKAEAEEEKAVDKQIADWQRWTSAPRK
jgi:hypothetical protein